MHLLGYFNFLTTALESRSDDLTWNFVTARVLYEEKRQQEHGNTSENATAFYGDLQKAPKKSGACHYCGELGHWANQYSKRIADNQAKQCSNNHEGSHKRRENVAKLAKADEEDFLFVAFASQVKADGQ